MILWAIRFLYLLALAGTAAKITNELAEWLSLSRVPANNMILFGSIMAVGIIVVVFDIFYPRKEISTITAIYFGVLIGTLLSHLLTLAFGPSVTIWASPQLVAPVSLALTLMLCYICTSILLQTKNDFRFVIPYVEFSRQLKGNKPLVLDTSVIIDGRIADIAETGLIQQVLIVPRVVLNELNTIAEGPDKYRRGRGRRGLDVLDRLQKCKKIEVQFHETEPAEPGVDGIESQVLMLSNGLNATLATNEVNLAKMAKIQGIETINVNDVSNASKPPVHHGEVIVVRLVKDGEEPGQGIGYLDDGTMVVAEMGKQFVGKEINLLVTSILQTHAGRMVFGRIDSKNPEPARMKQS